MIDQTALPVPQPAPRSAFYRTFVGPDGVRAGWKVILFFLVFAVISICLLPLHRLYPNANPKAPFTPQLALLEESMGAFAVVLATVLMARFVDRKPFGYFGMPMRRALGANFWIGGVVGLGALALQLELMHLGGWFDFGTLQMHGAPIVGYGLLWAVAFLLVGITEEGLLRGYVQRATTNGLSGLGGSASFWVSALLFSIMFGAGHLSNAGENKFGLLMVFLDGMTMCFSLWFTGDLWFAIGNHAAWDWGETFLFGTPNSGLIGQPALMAPSFHGPALFSGGKDGPEGSLLALLSEAVFVIAIALIYRHRRYPLAEEAASQGVALGTAYNSVNQPELPSLN